MRYVSALALVSLFSLGVYGLDLGGSWYTELSLADMQFTSSFFLDLALENLAINTVFTMQGTELKWVDISLETSLGALGFAAGALFEIDNVLVPMGTDWFTGFSRGEAEFVGGFVSFSLKIGDLSLKLTFVEGNYPLEGEK